MVILHIASINQSPFNGVSVAVPQHVKAQGDYATAGLLNIRNIAISDMGIQLPYEKEFRLEALQEPFCAPDVAVFHGVYIPDYLPIARQLRKNGIPYVIIPHGELRAEAQKKKWLKKKAANLLLFNRFIRGAAAIQCLSALELSTTRFGKRKFVGTNGIVIPEKYKQSFRQEGTRFVYIGRLESHVKGLDLMLEAVRLKADFFRENKCELHMYGPDWLGRYAVVEEMIREKGVGDIVTLRPAITGQEKEDTLLDGDIFIQTSRHEGMPMGILEALSYGVPCLVTRGTTLGEMIEEKDAGWMAENDAASIAEKLEEAVRDRAAWQTMGENGRQLVMDAFSWNRIAKAAVEQYNAFLK